MASDSIRMAFIGCGIIAKRHVLALEDLKARGRQSIEVIALCDANEENAQSLAQDVQAKLGVTPKLYKDYRNLFESEQLDAVDICLPHGLHHVVAIDAMEAGLHVICEKPLGVTIATSRKMVEAAKRTGKMLSTAVPYRRLPGQRTVRWILNESGIIGKPLSFFHQYTRPGQPRRPAGQNVPPALAWRLDRQMSGGGMVMDSGFHYCDSMCYFLGEPEKIYAELRNVGEGEPKTVQEAREDTCFATITFKNGVVGTWSWGLASAGESVGNVLFYGTEGSLRDLTPSQALIFHLFWRNPVSNLLEDGQVTKIGGETVRLAELEKMYFDTLSEEEREKMFPGGSEDGFAIEIHDFAEAIKGNRPMPEVDGEGGLKSLALCESIYESAFVGRPVLYDDVVSGKERSYQKMVDERWGLD